MTSTPTPTLGTRDFRRSPSAAFWFWPRGSICSISRRNSTKTPDPTLLLLLFSENFLRKRMDGRRHGRIDLKKTGHGLNKTPVVEIPPNPSRGSIPGRNHDERNPSSPALDRLLPSEPVPNPLPNRISSFVPGHDDHCQIFFPVRRTADLLHPLLHETVSGTDQIPFALRWAPASPMHIMAQVSDNKGKGRKLSSPQVFLQIPYRNDPALPSRVGPDLTEQIERIVAYDI